MGKRFTVEWDDFSGGYYIGQKGVNQPRNTWRGDDMIVTADEGLLMPGAEFQAQTSAALSTVVGVNTLRGRVDSLAGVDSVYFADKSGANLTLYKNDVSAFPTVTTTSQVGAPGAANLQSQNYYDQLWLTGFNGSTIAYGGQAATNPLVIFAPTGAGAVSAPGALGGYFQVVAHNEFAVAFSPTDISRSNRLHFSAPLDPTSWATADYYDIGNPTYPICCVISRAEELLIGKGDGWYSMTGVLGQTATLRKITTTGPSRFCDAVDTPFGVVYPSHETSASQEVATLRVLRGSHVEPLLSWPYPATPDGTNFRKSTVKLSQHHLSADAEDNLSLFVYSEMSRTWRRVLHPGPTALGLADVWFTPCANFGMSRYGYFVKQPAGVAPTDIRLYRYELEPVHPPIASGAFRSATAWLAEYKHESEFTIDRVYVELDLGVTSLSAIRQVQLQMLARGIPVENGVSPNFGAIDLSSVTSTTVGNTLTSNGANLASTNGERVMMRLRPNDAGAMMSVIPSITLQGVKLRRVVMQCVEVT